MNLKEKFAKELLNIVNDFEKETGVNIKNINFERVNTTRVDRPFQESTISQIEMKMD